jgi:hypothetical protein
VIEIAGGIILAVFFLALLPLIFYGLAWVLAFVLVVALAAGAVLLVWSGAQSPAGVAVELIISGVFLIWLHYEIKARRKMKAEQARGPSPHPER